MANLTIRMDAKEKQRLSAWAQSRGQSVTEYLKELIANDMSASSPESRARAWMKEHKDAIAAEAKALEGRGIPGADLALNYPKFDEDL